MALKIIDTFNRADSGTLGTSSDGGTWTAGENGAGGFAPGSPNIVSNTAQAVGDYRSAYHSTTMGPYCYAGFTTVSSTDDQWSADLMINPGSTAWTGYSGSWNELTGISDLYKIGGGGSDTLLGTNTVAWPGSGTLFKTEVNGDQVSTQYSVNGGQIWITLVTATDTTYRSTAFRPALFLGPTSAVDDYFADNVTFVMAESFQAIPFI